MTDLAKGPQAPGVQTDNSANNHKLTSAIDLFSKSKELVLRNLKIFVILFSLSALETILSSINHFQSTPAATKDSAPELESILKTATGVEVSAAFTVILAVILFFVIVSTIIYAMQNILFLRTAQGKKSSFQSLWTELQGKFWRLIGLYIVMFLVIGFGFALFIVPGVIFLRRYYFAPYILIDENSKITDAMNKSAELTKGNYLSVYSLIFMQILFAIPSIVPLIGNIITFILSFFYSTASALRYEELKKLRVN